MAIWRKLMERTGVQIELDQFSPAFLKKLCSYEGSIGTLTWKDLCPFIMWGIWIHRNKLIHDKKKFNSLWVLDEAIKAAKEFCKVHPNVVTEGKVKEEILITWQSASNGVFKLNTDGSSNGCGFARIGGIIRDEDGAFVACFGKHIFKNNNNVAEV
ncbi:uncharacterized protein LOC113326888 [Papaver somniferum]|uniref:uncharacterized protein LOC113326888 n=1 Tax=Papaver somniferum TaxID=3469 RepID=UPI000E6F9809|nr:uncharacterized protein LOC113326888 [Papaver somniferum]